MENLYTAYGSASKDLSFLTQRLQSEGVVPAACFTGHRSLFPADVSRLSALVTDAVRQAYDFGFRIFYCGAALGFDLLAGFAVMALRDSCPGLRLILVIPCSDQSRYWPVSEKRRWETLVSAADEVIIKSPAYYAGCMQVRNRYMVDHSHLCLCYLASFRGGTFSTVRYAQRQELPILNLALPLLEEQRSASGSMLREADHPYGIVRSYSFLRPKVPILRFHLLSRSGSLPGTVCGSPTPGGRSALRGASRPSPICRNRLYRRRHSVSSASSALFKAGSGSENTF